MLNKKTKYSCFSQQQLFGIKLKELNQELDCAEQSSQESAKKSKPYLKTHFLPITTCLNKQLQTANKKKKYIFDSNSDASRSLKEYDQITSLIYFDPTQQTSVLTPFKCAQSTSQDWMNLSKVIKTDTNQIDILQRQLLFNNTQKANFFRSVGQEQSRTNHNLLQNYKDYKKKQTFPLIKIQFKELGQGDQGANSIQLKMQPKPKPFNKIKGGQMSKREEQLFNQYDIENKGNDQLPQLKFYAYRLENMRTRLPDNRDSCTMTYLKDHVFLYGGIGRDICKDMQELNLRSFAWSHAELKGDIPPYGRYGHSANIYKNKLYIFGGEKGYNKHLKMKELLNDLYEIDLENKSMRTLIYTGDLVENRINHSAVIMGKFLIVVGGINSYNKLLTDVVAINLETLKAKVLDHLNLFSQKEDRIDGLAFHTAASCFRGELKCENLYKPYETKKYFGESRFRRVQYEGIYVFGGKLPSGRASNKLRILQIGQFPLNWIYPETKGIPPSPRYAHSMSYYKELNILIVYGGRDDEIISNKKQCPLMKDLIILNLEYLEWMHVEVIGYQFKPRCSHNAVIVESKMIIFGGITEKGYLDSELLIIEMDQVNAYKLYKDNENNIIPNIQQHILTIDDITKSNCEIYNFRYLPVTQNTAQAKHQTSFKQDEIKPSTINPDELRNMKTYQPFSSLIGQSSQINVQKKKQEQQHQLPYQQLQNRLSAAFAHYDGQKAIIITDSERNRQNKAVKTEI